MQKYIGILLSCLLVAAVNGAPRVVQTLYFSADKIAIEKVADYDLLTYEDLPQNVDIGRPSIPVKYANIAIPDGWEAFGISVIETDDDTLPGIYRLYPVQLPKSIGSQKKVEFTPPDSRYYDCPEYPENIIEIIGKGDIAGQNLCAVRISPLTYIPSKGKVILHKKIKFQVELQPSNTYKKGIKLTKYTESLYKNMLQRIVINPEDIRLISRPGTPKILPNGTYEYVIITPERYVENWMPLLNWKKEKGLKDTIITVEWIYSNYDGPTKQEKLRRFVEEANSVWSTVWLLIGGDVELIPVKEIHYPYPGYASSDYYLADYDTDWYQEVFVGRATIDNEEQINTFIQKVFHYERNPDRNYAKRVLLIGMDADGRTHTELMKDTIRLNSIPDHLWVTKVYDSYQDNHLSRAIRALNYGQNLVNHSDHSNWCTLGIGHVNHRWHLTEPDVDALENDGKLCVIYSLGCHSNDFEESDAISEHFVVYNPNRAGVAYIGNTGFGWYNPGYYNTLSMLMDREWWKSLFQYDVFRIGETLADSKNRNYPDSIPFNDTLYYGDLWGFYKYIHYGLALLGDPEMPLWTDSPDTFIVMYPETVAFGSEIKFTVNVYDNLSPVDSAFVCIYMPGHFHERGYTKYGKIIFTVDTKGGGPIYVTVTKHNFIPFQGISHVADRPVVADFQAIPRHGVKPLDVQFIDLSTGNISSWHWFFGTGDESYQQEPIYTYVEAGDFDVKLIVNGAYGPDTTLKPHFIHILEEAVFIRGDVNADGSVDVTDMSYLMDHLFPPQFPCMKAADCNDDGEVDITDVNYLWDNMFSGNIPAPYPDCGVDPTPDDLSCTSFPPCGLKSSQPGDRELQNSKVTAIAQGNRVDVKISSEFPLFAFQIELKFYEAPEIKKIDYSKATDNFIDLRTVRRGNSIILYGIGSLNPLDKKSAVIPEGEHEIATLILDNTYASLKSISAILSSANGSKINPTAICDNEISHRSHSLTFTVSPNPAKDILNLEFSLPKKEVVNISIYNVIGQQVISLADGEYSPGMHLITWNMIGKTGKKVPRGTYFCTMKTGSRTLKRKFSVNY